MKIYDPLDPDNNTYCVVYSYQLRFIQWAMVLVLITRMNFIAELLEGGYFGHYHYIPQLSITKSS